MPAVNLEALKGLQAMHRLGQEQMMKRHALLKGVNPSSRKLQTGSSIQEKMAKEVAMRLNHNSDFKKNKTIEAKFNDYGKNQRFSHGSPQQDVQSSELLQALKAAQSLMKKIEPKTKLDQETQNIEKLRKQAHSMQSVKIMQLNNNFLPKLRQDSKGNPDYDLANDAFQVKQKSFMTP